MELIVNVRGILYAMLAAVGDARQTKPAFVVAYLGTKCEHQEAKIINQKKINKTKAKVSSTQKSNGINNAPANVN